MGISPTTTAKRPTHRIIYRIENISRSTDLRSRHRSHHHLASRLARVLASSPSLALRFVASGSAYEITTCTCCCMHATIIEHAFHPASLQLSAQEQDESLKSDQIHA